MIFGNVNTMPPFYLIKNSKPWLGYVERTGAFDDPILVASLSPHMPAYEEISHDWLNFTLGNPMFGNNGASWVFDDNTGD